MNINEAVFTTKYVLTNQSPIVYVIHDLEGAWQFFGSEEHLETEDARIVSLGEIIEMDTTIKEILWMPEGVEARRAQVGDEWTTRIYSED